jgi:hypothetical protein
MSRTRVLLIAVVALVAVAAFAPAAGAGVAADEPVSIDVLFTQPEPMFDEFGELVSPPNGVFSMSGAGAVCDGGLFYDQFIGDVEVSDDLLTVHDFKVFTCDTGETFTLEFWVTFVLPAFEMIESSWTVSASNVAGLTGLGTITERTFPSEVWGGVFGTFDCKKGGWRTLTDMFGTPFKNQGDCVSYLATNGRNLADG